MYISQFFSLRLRFNLASDKFQPIKLFSCNHLVILIFSVTECVTVVYSFL